MNSILLGILLLAVLIVVWRDSMRARERAIEVSRAACRSYGLQLLDDTVALSQIRVGRKRGQGWQVLRIYEFETSADRLSRRSGSVTLTGDHVDAIYVPEPQDSGPE